MAQIKHFNTILQWFSKSQEKYGLDKVIDYDYESFLIDLSEQYQISFAKEGDVIIGINRDLHDYAERLYYNEKEREKWIENEIQNIIKTLKIELKSILTIIKRSVKSQKISVKLKNLPDIILFEK